MQCVELHNQSGEQEKVWLLEVLNSPKNTRPQHIRNVSRACTSRRQCQTRLTESAMTLSTRILIESLTEQAVARGILNQCSFEMGRRVLDYLVIERVCVEHERRRIEVSIA